MSIEWRSRRNRKTPWRAGLRNLRPVRIRRSLRSHGAGSSAPSTSCGSSVKRKACGEGELGALLRREGLYSSHLSVWRRQREDGSLEGLTPKKRGRKGKRKDPLAERNAELERENRKLKKRLEQAETIIEFQKKVSEVLGIPLKSPESGESDS